MEELSLERKDPKSKLSLKTTDLPSRKYEDHLRTAFAGILTATTIPSAYYGLNLPQAVMAGSFTLVVCNIRFPTMRMLVKLSLGALVCGVPLICVELTYIDGIAAVDVDDHTYCRTLWRERKTR
jgi:hypothetical protein